MTSEQKHSVFYWKQLQELCHSLRPPRKSVITDHEKPSVTPLASQWFWKSHLLHGISSWIEPGYLDMGWGTIKPTGQIWPTLRDLNGTQTCPLAYGCVWLPLLCSAGGYKAMCTPTWPFLEQMTNPSHRDYAVLITAACLRYAEYHTTRQHSSVWTPSRYRVYIIRWHASLKLRHSFSQKSHGNNLR